MKHYVALSNIKMKVVITLCVTAVVMRGHKTSNVKIIVKSQILGKPN